MDAFKDTFDSMCAANGVELTKEHKDALFGIIPSTKEAEEIAKLSLPGNNASLRKAGLRFDDRMVASLVDALMVCPVGIEVLDLSYNNITDVGASALARFLTSTGTSDSSKSINVRELILRGNDIGEDGGAALAQALQNNKSLVNLDLSGNAIGHTGGLEFARMLTTNRTIKSLFLNDTGLDMDAVLALASVLAENNNTLEVFGFERPSLPPVQSATASKISHMLRTNTGLKKVYLGKHGFRDEDAKQIATMMQENGTLELLDLRCNKITSFGGEALAALLLRGSPLKGLNLDCNRIGKSGGKAFAIALQSSTVEFLSVKSNSIDDEAMCELCGGVAACATLRVLRLWGNTFGDLATPPFAALLDGRLRSLGVQCDFKAYSNAEGDSQIAENECPDFI